MSKTRWPRKAEKNMGLGWLRSRTLSDMGSPEVHHVNRAITRPQHHVGEPHGVSSTEYSSACRRHLGKNQFRHPFSVQGYAEPEQYGTGNWTLIGYEEIRFRTLLPCG